MRSILSYIDNQNSKDVMVHHERKIVIMQYRKNSSTSIEHAFGQKGKEWFGDPSWSIKYLSECADEVKDYTFINVLRDPTSRILSAINQSVNLIQRTYGCIVSPDSFDYLSRACDVHLMPQILTVASDWVDGFLDRELGGVYKNGWPKGANAFSDQTVDDMRENRYSWYPEDWNQLLELIDANKNLLCETDNPKQVWFCATKSNNVVIDILEYLEYDIKVNPKNIVKRNVAQDKGNEMHFSKTLIDKIEASYEYDYKLYNRARFQNL